MKKKKKKKDIVLIKKITQLKIYFFVQKFF